MSYINQIIKVAGQFEYKLAAASAAPAPAAPAPAAPAPANQSFTQEIGDGRTVTYTPGVAKWYTENPSLYAGGVGGEKATTTPPAATSKYKIDPALKGKDRLHALMRARAQQARDEQAAAVKPTSQQASSGAKPGQAAPQQAAPQQAASQQAQPGQTTPSPVVSTPSPRARPASPTPLKASPSKAAPATKPAASQDYTVGVNCPRGCQHNGDPLCAKI